MTPQRPQATPASTAPDGNDPPAPDTPDAPGDPAPDGLDPDSLDRDSLDFDSLDFDSLDPDSLDRDTLDFDKGAGLIPVIAQHWLTGEVLMLGYATREALDASLETGLLTFHSRSRDTLWTKGETSGNTLRVIALTGDCDGDAILARVDPAGPTCHTGERSCFPAAPTLRGLADTLAARRDADPDRSYTARLLADRNHRLKKLGEEATELAVACADEDVERVREEAADVVYHTLVAAMAAGVGLDEILAVLEKRRG